MKGIVRLTALIAVLILFATGCRKEFSPEKALETTVSVIHQDDHCKVLMDTKKDAEARKHKDISVNNTSGVSCNPFVILIVFNGATVTSSSWNEGASFACPASGLDSISIGKVLAIVEEDYSPYKNYRITTSQALYDAADPYNRAIHIVTVDVSQQVGGAYGGISYINSGSWGDGTPSFTQTAFTGGDLITNLGNGISHELGHMFGLYHLAQWSNGTFVYEYENGINPGNFLSNAKTMGSYNNCTFVNWGIGRIPAWAGGTIQNDAEILSAKLGTKSDDYGNTFSTATDLRTSTATSFSGLLGFNDPADVIFIKGYVGKGMKLTLITGGNCHPEATICDGKTKAKIKVLASNTSLTATVTVPANSNGYYVETKRRGQSQFGAGTYTIKKEKVL